MKRRPDTAKTLFVLSGVVLVFVYGVTVGAYRVFPYAAIKSGVDAVQVVWQERSTLAGVRPESFLRPARHEGDGVTVARAERASPGLTLVSGFFEDTNELRLLALDGTVVRRWPVRFSEIFPDPTHIEPESRIPATDWNVDIHGALALPDGSVLFNFEYGGMVKLGRCGEVEWTVPRMTHHSIERAEDGSFWVGGRRYVEDPSAVLPWKPPYFEDRLVKVSPDGRVLAELPVTELLLDNDLEHVLFAKGHYLSEMGSLREATHLNDIDPLTPVLATVFPDFSAGDLLLSFRDVNLIAVLDPSSRKVKWHQAGPWIRQHDPDFEGSGKISVFDNRTDDTETGDIFGGSRIVEVDPATGDLAVRVGSDPSFYTRVRGKHQTLVNGNVLVVESLAGRVFETAPGGEVVWEFVNRFDDDEVALMNDAIRYAPGYFTVSDWMCE